MDAKRLEVTILLPVSVEKNPLFTFAIVVFVIYDVRVLPAMVEKPRVEAIRVEV